MTALQLIKKTILTSTLVFLSVQASAETRGGGKRPMTFAPSSSYQMPAGPSHEVKMDATEAHFVSAGSMTVLTASASYFMYVYPKIQAGGIASFNSVSGGGVTGTTITAVATGIYNLEEHLDNSIYFMAGLGLQNASSSTNFGFLLGGGKRFPIWGNLLYDPKATYAKFGSGDGILTITPLAISIMY